MFKVIDKFEIGMNLSVTFEGICEGLKNGSKLKTENGNECTVISVGMTRYNNPSDISKSTTVLLSPCNIRTGDTLYIA